MCFFIAKCVIITARGIATIEFWSGEMKIIDLTRPLTEEIPLYPGDEAPKIEQIKNLDSDGYRAKRLTITTHTGTHIDSPSHLFKSGATLDEISPEQFLGTAIVADVSSAKDTIEVSDIKLPKADIFNTDFLLLYTGAEEVIETEGSDSQTPVLSQEAADFLASMPLKGVGFDALSPDDIKSRDLKNHRTFFHSKMIIIENLINLKKLPIGKQFCLVALPLLASDSDGCPARVLAIL